MNIYILHPGLEIWRARSDRTRGSYAPQQLARTITIVRSLFFCCEHDFSCKSCVQNYCFLSRNLGSFTLKLRILCINLYNNVSGRQRLYLPTLSANYTFVRAIWRKIARGERIDRAREVNLPPRAIFTPNCPSKSVIS